GGERTRRGTGVGQAGAGAVPPFSEAALADVVQVLTTLEEMAATVPPEAPWTAPNAIAWDATTFGQWLDANVQTDETKWLLTLGFTIVEGEDPHSASLLWILRVIATSGGIEHMLGTTGGAQDSPRLRPTP